MDRPFRELHELYRLLFLRAQEQAAAEKAKQEEEERKKNNEQKRPKPPGINYPQGYSRARLADATRKNSVSMPSAYEAEVLEDALEDLVEGGVM